MADNWADVPLVFVRYPLCPFCRHKRYLKIRTTDNHDESYTKKVVCAGCSKKFLIVTEPVSGKDVVRPC